MVKAKCLSGRLGNIMMGANNRTDYSVACYFDNESSVLTKVLGYRLGEFSDIHTLYLILSTNGKKGSSSLFMRDTTGRGNLKACFLTDG